MKKCNDCNVDMIDNCTLEGQHLFELGANGSSDIYIHTPTGEQGNILGINFEKTTTHQPKARYCPKCGKVELYIDINN